MRYLVAVLVGRGCYELGGRPPGGAPLQARQRGGGGEQGAAPVQHPHTPSARGTRCSLVTGAADQMIWSIRNTRKIVEDQPRILL